MKTEMMALPEMGRPSMSVALTDAGSGIEDRKCSCSEKDGDALNARHCG